MVALRVVFCRLQLFARIRGAFSKDVQRQSGGKVGGRV
jgi:hypothetical protein